MKTIRPISFKATAADMSRLADLQAEQGSDRTAVIRKALQEAHARLGKARKQQRRRQQRQDEGTAQQTAA